MSPLLGYGEDALTLCAITERCEELLQLLGDKTDAADALCIYRPSFGRRGANHADPDSGQSERAAFGEFDAMAATTNLEHFDVASNKPSFTTVSMTYEPLGASRFFGLRDGMRSGGQSQAKSNS